MRYDPSGYYKSLGIRIIKGDVPGHPFRGNQYTTTAGEEMYHGTTTERLESILKSGIEAGHQKNWADRFFRGDRKGKVFFTQHKNTALDYAADALRKFYSALPVGGEVTKMPLCVLFKIEIPKGTKLEVDESVASEMGKHSFMLKNIPPEWIKGYELHDFNPFNGKFKLKESHKVGKSVGVFYVPILFEG